MHRPVVILLLAGLFADAALALDNAISLRLDAQSNSGQAGTAILVPEGDKTKVVIEFSNVRQGLRSRRTFHRGSCDALDKAPKWSLKAVTDGRSVTMIPVSLNTLLKDRMAINIHKSAIET
jgi:hypothetical protein